MQQKTVDIFSLIRNQNELPSTNNNMANMFYREVQPLRNVQDILVNNGTVQTQSVFGNGIISLRWTLDNKTWWVPSRSYMKFDIQITDKNGNPLNGNEEIAPSMGICANLIQKMQFKMADTTVDSIDENLAECDAMMERLVRNQNWMSSNIGNDITYWNAYHKERIQQISSKGKLGVKVGNNIEITNKTDLGYGQVIDGLDGVGIAVAASGDLTFSANNSGITLPRIEDVWNVGDVINIKYQGTTIWLTFFVVAVKTSNAGDSLLIHGDAAVPVAKALGDEGGVEFERWRFGCAKALSYSDIGLIATDKTVIVVDDEKTDGAGLITFTDAADAANPRFQTGIQNGDPIFIRSGNAEANTLLRGYLRDGPSPIDTANAFQLATYNRTPAVANGINGIRTLHYAESEIVKGEELGFTKGDANGYAVEFVPGAGTFDTLVITPQGLGTAPNLRRLFRKGDLLTFTSSNEEGNGGDETQSALRYCWVQRVDITNNNNLVLEISGPLALANGFGGDDDSNYTLAARIRYCGDHINNIARKQSTFQVCWKPSCLGVFNYAGALPGGTKFELELTPFTNKFYQIRGIETPYGIDKQHINAGQTVGDYRFLITDLRYYILQVDGPVTALGKDSYYLPTEEIKCHKQTLTTGNLTQTNLDVMPSSFAFSLAFQDSRSGSLSYVSPSKFHVGNKEELNIKRYSIRFGGLSLPQPDADLRYNNSDNLLVNSYMRNMLYNQLYSEDGESFEEWKERGIYFYHPFLRSATNRETHAAVITDFGKAFTNPNNVRLLLFEFYQRAALIKMDAGRVYSITVANA